MKCLIEKNTIDGLNLDLENAIKLNIYLNSLTENFIINNNGTITVDGKLLNIFEAINSIESDNSDLNNSALIDELKRIIALDNESDEMVDIPKPLSVFNETYRRRIRWDMPLHSDSTIANKVNEIMAHNSDVLIEANKRIEKLKFQGVLFNETFDFDKLTEEQQKIVTFIMKDIAVFFDVNDIIPHPNETVENLIKRSSTPSLMLRTLSDKVLLDNVEVIHEEKEKEYKSYLNFSLRKFMFGFLLDNLKFKFGIDYEWVSNAPFKARLHNGVVQINQDLFSDDDPFHEYLHAIILALKEENPELYNKLVNLPQVQQLAIQLSQDQIYSEYPEEEALVRLLSQPYMEFTYKDLFFEFLKWLRNLFSKVFKIKGNIITLNTNISNLSSILLDNNKYLLNTNYFKDKTRYSNRLSDFKAFDDIAKTKKLTPEQEKIRDKILKNINLIENITPQDEKYEVKFNDGQELLLSRPTSIDKKDDDSLANLDPSLKHMGTIQHAIFSKFLELKLKGTTKDKMIKDIELKTSKSSTKYWGYVDDSYQQELNNQGSNRTIGETTGFDNDSYWRVNRPQFAFANAVIESYESILNDTSIPDEERDAIRKLFNSSSEITIKALYEQQEKMLDEILSVINQDDKNQKVKFEDLLIYSELFIHNYDGSSPTDLYGGTVDIYIVTPDGRQYVFDIKTRSGNKIKSGVEKLQKEMDTYYSVQQSIYRELIAKVTDSFPFAINSNILITQRLIKFELNESKLDLIKSDLLKLNNDDDWEDFINDLFNKNKEGYQRRIGNFLKNIVFNLDITDESRFSDDTKKYINDLKSIVPFDDLKEAIGKIDVILDKSSDLSVRSVLSSYIPSNLRSRNVNILDEMYADETFIKVLRVLDILKSHINILEDKILIYSKAERSDNQERKLNIMKKTLDSFNNERKKISSALEEIVNKNKIALENNNSYDYTNDLLDIFKNPIMNYDSLLETIDAYIKNIYRQFNKQNEYTKELYKSLYENLEELLKNINESIVSRKSILNADKNELKRLESKILSLLVQIRSETDPIKIKSLTEEYYAVYSKFLILENNIRNSEKVITDLGKYKESIKKDLYNVEYNFTLDNLQQNAKMVLNGVKEALEILNDASQDPEIRASYVKFIQKSINLYSDLPALLDDEITKDMTEINEVVAEFIKAKEEAHIAYKNLIADLITNYELNTDRQTLSRELNTIDSEISIIKAKLNQLDFLITPDNENLKNTLDDLLTKNTDKSNELVNFIISQRETKIAKINDELNLKGNGITFNFALESFLPASRSKYVMVQIFALLENEINNNYANKFRIISEEVQDKSIHFAFNYNGGEVESYSKIFNAYEEYTAFDKLIARTTDTSLEQNGIDYLMLYDEGMKRYNFENIFDDKDITAVKGKSETEIRNYIRNNNLVDKYKTVKTLTLIDRGKWGYVKEHESEKDLLVYALRATKNKYKIYPSANENVLKSIEQLMKKKFTDRNNTSYAVDIRLLKFKEYVHYIFTLYNHFKELNEIKEKRTIKKAGRPEIQENSLYSDIEKLFSEELSNFFDSNFVNLNQYFNNEVEDLKLLNEFRNALSDSNYYDKILSKLLNRTSTDSFEEVSSQLHDQVITDVQSYYGKNYGLLAIEEALKNFSKYEGVMGKHYTDRERNISFIESKKLSEINSLKSIIKSIESNLISELNKGVNKSDHTIDTLKKDLERFYEMYIVLLPNEQFNEQLSILREELRSNLIHQDIYNLKNNVFEKFIKIKDNYKDKYHYILEYKHLESLLSTSPFAYIDLSKTLDSQESFDLFHRYNPEINLVTITMDDEFKFLDESIQTAEKTNYTSKTVINPQGYKYTFENASKNYFDSAWDEFEANQTLFDYYRYVRKTLEYLYQMVPRSELQFASYLDLPVFEKNSFLEKLDDLRKDNKGLTRQSIMSYLQDEYTKSITNSLQNDKGTPFLSTRPISFININEMRNVSSNQNFQLDHLLQMLAYGALLTKERIDKYPISQMIVDVVTEHTNKKGQNTELTDAIKFNHFVNNTGIMPLNMEEINQYSNSKLTNESQQELDTFQFELNILMTRFREIETRLNAINERIDVAIASNKKINDTDRLLKRDLTIESNNLKRKINLLNGRIRDINNTGKVNSSALIRLWINTARKVQLTYSLTGQFNNLLQGLMQTSIVAARSEEEMEAYTESIKILNNLLFDSKVLAGSAYAGNILTTALTGNSFAGIVSIPAWMFLARKLVENMGDISFIKKQMTPDVIKAINMEINYNISFDIVEESRNNEPQKRYYEIKNNEVVRTQEQAAEVFKPFGFVKRAEKMIVIQNMLIQSFVTKVKVPQLDENDNILKDSNGDTLYEMKNFWDIHNQEGQIKNVYIPYVNKQEIDVWGRQLYDRLHKANGNYTSKYQIEKHWWGRLMTVYSKWMFETMRNYFGKYVPAEENLFTSEPHEGIARSAYKKGIENFYTLVHDKVIDDFPLDTLEQIPIVAQTDSTGFKRLFGAFGSNMFERIIIYKNGSITWNTQKKVDFVNSYNNIVSSDLSDEDKIKQIKDLVKEYDIKVFRDQTPEEKASFKTDMKKLLLRFLSPFDFGKSVKDRTVTRNVKDRLSDIFGAGENLTGYEKLRHQNLRSFFNFTHVLYSMFLTKTMLLIIFGYMTKVLGYDDDDEGIKSMKFIINRYNQMWSDMSYYSNPISAFYKYFHNGFSTVKFVLELQQLNVDIAATMPHLINKMLGDSEMGDVILESMGLRDPILEKSKGLTNIRPVNDFIDLIPMINKMGGIYKQSVNTYD